MTQTHLLTSGDIARELDLAPPKVRYILDTRLHIVPVARAGIVRLYDAGAVELVRRELEDEDNRDASRGGHNETS